MTDTVLTPDQQQILIHLGAKPMGQGWIAHCPCTDRHKNGDVNPSLGIMLGEDGWLHPNCFAKCDRDKVREASGFKLVCWGPAKKDRPRSQAKAVKRIVARYPYYDVRGHLKYEVVRYEPKNFSRRHLDRPTQSWVWTLDACECVQIRPGHWVDANSRSAKFARPDSPRANFREVPLLPYRLPEWSNEKGTVFFAEGEKDSDTVKSLGYLSTAIPGGTTDAQLVSMYPYFRHRTFVILQDNDEPGMKRAMSLVYHLMRAEALGVMLFVWPSSFPDGFDVTDWVEAHRASKASETIEEDFLAMVKERAIEFVNFTI